MKRKARTRMEVMDAFLMGLLRQAREHGIQEERQRVVDYVRSATDSALQSSILPDMLSRTILVARIERGEHDAGRTFKAYSWSWPEDEDLPVSGDADTTNVNPSALTPPETPCQSVSTRERKARPA